MTSVLILLFICVAFVFFYIGKYNERVHWNKLIEDGIIPKPIKTRTGFNMNGHRNPPLPPPVKKDDTLSCWCDNGIITCPGCNGEQSKFGVCAGCQGKGKAVCGKCGGKNNKTFKPE